MKSAVKIIFPCLFILFFSVSAFGADVTAAVDVNSAYVWRGITFNDGIVVQPSIDVTSGGFGFNAWGNLDADDYDDTLESGEFSEVDLTLTYGFDAGPVGITAGYIEYLFPTTEAGGGEGTREVFLDMSAEPGAGISTGITAYYDIDEVEDFYLNAYLGYGLAFDSGFGIDLGASAGFAGDEYSADGDAGLYDYNLSLGASYGISEALSVGCFVAYTDTFDKDVLPEQDTDVYGGANISFSF